MNLLLALLATLQDAPYDGPLLDAHCHVPMSETLTLEGMIDLQKKNGVTALYFHDFGPGKAGERPILAAQKKDPKFVFPFFHIPEDNKKKGPALDDEKVAALDKGLKAGTWRGVAELPLYKRNTKKWGPGYPADGPLALKVFDLVADAKVPLSIHLDSEKAAELDKGLKHNEKAKIIWAHAGDGPASLVGKMIADHPNLYADLSARNPYLQRGVKMEDQTLTDDTLKLKPEWKALLEKYPDRFLYGSDIGTVTERQDTLEETVKYSRTILGQLDRKTAEKIGYRNALALIGADESAIEIPKKNP